MTHKIYPCLWFDNQAKEAANFYCDVFKDARIVDETGLVVTFEAGDMSFMCLNGGPNYKPNASISFYVVCETMEEVQDAWAKLAVGGKVFMPLDEYAWSDQYGWIADRYGVSWQLSLGALEDVGQKYTPCLLYTEDQCGRAAEAIELYTSVFSPSKVVGVLPYAEGDGDIIGNVKHAQFRLGDRVMMAMDSSLTHGFTFTEGVSLVVPCDTQEEIDHYWDRLSEGGYQSNCGWLQDRFGVSWQIVPAILPKLMTDPDRAPRVVQAFMKMKKFDIEALLNA